MDPWDALLRSLGVWVDDGITYGDYYAYSAGVTTKSLLSGRDGPHTREADLMCSLRKDSL